MRKLLLTAALCVITVPAMAAGDTKMTCSDIEKELEALASIETAAGNAELTNTVTQTAGSAAMSGAAAAGVGSVPVIGGLANLAGAFSSHNERKAEKAAKDAEKRAIRLETMAEMKGCDF